MSTTTKLVILLAVLAAAASPAAFASAREARSGEFEPEVVNLARRLPVQDDGRVKPLLTRARFTLLGASGRTTAKTSTGEDAETLSATEWLLDCVFFPAAAERYPVLLIEDAEVLTDLGLAHVARKKRDRYSYAEIAPARDRLIAKAREYQAIDAKERTTLQGHVLSLAMNFLGIEDLLHFLDFVDDPAAVRFSTALAFLPPPGPPGEEKEWLTPAGLAHAAADGKGGIEAQTGILGRLAELRSLREKPEAFAAAFRSFSDDLVSLAESRGEYGPIPLEVTYYRGRFLFLSQMLFGLGFLLLIGSWLLPGFSMPRGGKWLYRSASAVLLSAVLVLVVAITLRCIIRDRPPVTTLYESILFITAVGTLVALTIEWMNRRRIAVAFAAFLGLGGLFLAGRYEVMEGRDTMPTLVAVLDTNFWLSTHVTAVTIGYTAGLLACAIGHLYVFGRMFGFRKDQPAFYRDIGRMLYGVLCFGLFFATIGTILGGIWANDSWGRFWGWDPKENGALMIVLWLLAVLHGRMGGYLRDYGIALASMFGGIVVAFSWWGVNQLGVGLHSYGFTDGIAGPLWAYYGLETLAVLAGIVYHLSARRTAGASPSS